MTNSQLSISNSPISQNAFFEAPVASHEIDQAGVICRVNRAECELLGYEPEDLVGHHVSDFAVPEQRDAVRDRIARKIAGEEALNIITREYRRSDGSYIWLEIHERLIANAEGEIVGIRSALIDITQRREHEEQTKWENARMKSIFRSLPKALVTTDPLGRIDFMNPAAEKLTGWSQKEGLGRAIEEICRVRYSPGEAVDLAPCMLSEPVFSNRLGTFDIVDRGGASHPITWLMFPIRSESGVIVGVVLETENA